MNSNTNIDKYPDNKVHGANMGPIWGRQEPDGPHVGPMNLALWDHMPCKVWDKIINESPNFSGCTVEVWEKGRLLLSEKSHLNVSFSCQRNTIIYL